MVVEDVVACGSKQTAWEPLKVPERGLLVEDSLGFEAGVYLETPNFFWNHPISSGPYWAEKLFLFHFSPLGILSGLSSNAFLFKS